MILDTPKSFQPEKKDIKYLNKDFSQLKDSLLEFAKTYYPGHTRISAMLLLG